MVRNRKVCAVRRFEEWASHPFFTTRNQVRASEGFARARLSFELPGSRLGMALVAIS